jgi:hypothetical protein
MLAVKGDLEKWRGHAPAYRTWFAQNAHFNINIIRELQVA